jgi:mono/diheme cytochrome c family protein
MRNKLSILYVLAIMISLNSCKKEDDAPVVPKTTFVDVTKILATNCAPCHVANSGANFDARVKHVDNYTIAKGAATFILDRIQRDPTAAGFMPRGKPKLSEADIAVIKKWIDDGLLEK